MFETVQFTQHRHNGSRSLRGTVGGDEVEQQEELTPEQELGRRVKAARVYRDVTQTQLGKELGHGRQTIGRWENGEVDTDYKRESLEKAAAKVTDMPREFFSIDFDDLPNMVRAWDQANRLQKGPADLKALIDERLRRGPKRR